MLVKKKILLKAGSGWRDDSGNGNLVAARRSEGDGGGGQPIIKRYTRCSADSPSMLMPCLMSGWFGKQAGLERVQKQGGCAGLHAEGERAQWR